MECSEFLAASVQEFIRSDMFKGGTSYPTKKGKRWYTWLYLARKKENAINNQIKVGITNNLRRRDGELEGMEIQWSWSMPTSQLVEKDIKQILHEFIKPRREKQASEPGHTEIIQNIPFVALIPFIRLVILYVYLKYKFIRNGDTNMFDILKEAIGDDSSEPGGRINPNAIEFGEQTYKGHSDSGLFKATKIIYQRLHGPNVNNIDQAYMGKYFKKIVRNKRNKQTLAGINKEIKAVQKIIRQEEFEKLRTCNLDHVYEALGIDIDDIDEFPKDDPSKKRQLSNLSDLEDSSDESLSDTSEDDTQNVDPPSDRPPTNTRRKQLKKNCQIYIAHKVTANTQQIFRFYFARVRKATHRPKKQETKVEYDLITQQGDIKDPLKGGKVRTARLKWNKERSDFRDRPGENKSADGAWGVYKAGDPTPGMNPLIKGRLDWQPENHPHFEIGTLVNLLKAKPGSKSGTIGHLSGPVRIVGIGDNNTITIEYKHGGQKKRSDVHPERLENIEK